MKAQTLVIHLARAERRRAQVEKLIRDLPFPGAVIDAVDGLALSAEAVEAVYRPHLHEPRYPFELRRAEVGCFLSHRKAWQAIVDGGLDFGLIVEDDVEIDTGRLGEILSVASGVIGPGDYLRFPQKLRGEEGPQRAAAGAVSIIEPALPRLGMVLQLVGREAAAALLNTTRQFDRPVDTMIQMRWLHPIRILAARPICVREISAEIGGTLIQNKKKPQREWLSRELRRALYRRAVRRKSVAGQAADNDEFH